jgi:cyclase
LDVADNGRVVKGIQFEGLRDVGDPVEMARRYSEQGADELAFLDINASHKSRGILLDLLRKVSTEVPVPLCVAGGIRTVQDMEEVMKAGAKKVSVCSSALTRPELLSEMAQAFGKECVVLSIDAKRVPIGAKRVPIQAKRVQKGVWHAFSMGGRTDSGWDVVEWAQKATELGAGEIILNSMDADGTGQGYDLELCAAVCSIVSVPVIASSGAGNLEQIAAVFNETGVDGALVASMLHFGKTTIPEIKKYLESKGIGVQW